MSIDVLLSEGKKLDDEGKYEEAVTCYDKAIKIDPKNAEAWRGKGKSLAMISAKKAMICFDRLIEVKPADVRAWAWKEMLSRLLERYEEAIACSDRLIELKPEVGRPWTKKGYALSKLERYEEAIACFDKAIEMKYEVADSWMNKGIVFDRSGKVEEATECFSKATELDPTDSYEWTVKGYKTEKDADGHHQMFVHYVEKSYSEGKRVHMPRAADYDEAIKCYNKAIEIYPDNSVAAQGKEDVSKKQENGW